MYYGWNMVALAFFTHFLIAGSTFYSFGVVLKPLADEFGGGRFGATTLPLAMSLAGGVIAPFVGRWVAAGSIRTAMTLGCVATAAGYFLGARATALWQLAFLFGTLLALGLQTMGGVAASTLVVNWFQRKRATAVGLSLVGVSLSGVVMAHVTTALVQSGGWRFAFDIFGWAILLAAPVVWLTAVGHPEERGLHPDGDAEPPAPPPGAAGPPGVSAREALREPNLWIIAVTCGLAFLGTSSIMMHSVAMATDMGFSPERAAWLLSILAAGSMGGKLLFGWLADRVGERAALFTSLGIQVVGTVGFVGAGSLPLLLALAGLLGLGFGGLLPLLTALLARAFGRARFAPMMGYVTPLLIPFQAAGTPFAGWVVDTTGSYAVALWTFASLLVVAAAMLSLLRLEPEAPAAALRPAESRTG